MLHPFFSGVVGHEEVLALLTRVVGHPGQAYLFLGPPHVGKRLVAERFAHALLKRPLDQPLDAHPDFIRALREPDAKAFTVKPARDLIRQMQLTPACGGRKIALIAEAERLNEEAANALLKAVEEPTPSSVYLFVSSLPERLPATMRSRLAPITFGPLPSRVEAGPPEAKARALLLTLLHQPIGVQIAELEKTAKRLEATDDPEAAWRDILCLLMHAMKPIWRDDPAPALRLGGGLIHAWHLAGTTLSPRLALEWSASRPYLMEDGSPTFTFLTPSFL